MCSGSDSHLEVDDLGLDVRGAPVALGAGGEATLAAFALAAFAALAETLAETLAPRSFGEIQTVRATQLCTTLSAFRAFATDHALPLSLSGPRKGVDHGTVGIHVGAQGGTLALSLAPALARWWRRWRRRKRPRRLSDRRCHSAKHMRRTRSVRIAPFRPNKRGDPRAQKPVIPRTLFAPKPVYNQLQGEELGRCFWYTLKDRWGGWALYLLAVEACIVNPTRKKIYIFIAKIGMAFLLKIDWSSITRSRRRLHNTCELPRPFLHRKMMPGLSRMPEASANPLRFAFLPSHG